ncbi:MAG: Hsp20/alpha crystallin family protein [Planctomycetes bacterium]|nr:Hsp20/alpha crystallin family protein [Planctomycetota bacterium]
MSHQLTEWRPFGRTLFPELPQLFNEFNEMFRREAGRNGESWSPRVELIEKPDAYEVKAELPGCKAADIKVNLTGNTLSIHGEKRQEERRSEENVHIYERSHGVFHRSFTLPSAVEADGVKAETQDGILTVKVKKAEKAKSREIKVEAKSK